MSVFPIMALPFDCRDDIYHKSEPHVTIDLAYPDNIRKRFELEWIPNHRTNPMLGLSAEMDQEVLSRYFNRGNPSHPPFVPESTTFRLYAKRSRVHQINVERFFEHDKRNIFGVRHLELIVDNFKGSAHGVNLDDLKRFPMLLTVDIIMRYETREMYTEERKDELDAEMKKLVKDYFKECGIPEDKQPNWALERQAVI